MLKHRGVPGRMPGTDFQFTIRRANVKEGATKIIRRERFKDRKALDRAADTAFIAALWDYIQRERFNDQTDTLILLNQQQHDEDEHIQRIKRLQHENKQLKAQLQHQPTPVKTSPRAGASAALADVEKLYSALTLVK